MTTPLGVVSLSAQLRAADAPDHEKIRTREAVENLRLIFTFPLALGTAQSTTPLGVVSLSAEFSLSLSPSSELFRPGPTRRRTRRSRRVGPGRESWAGKAAPRAAGSPPSQIPGRRSLRKCIYAPFMFSCPYLFTVLRAAGSPPPAKCRCVAPKAAAPPGLARGRAVESGLGPVPARCRVSVRERERQDR